MRTLYHYPLCAFSRSVRIYLKEKAFDHELVVEVPWNRKKHFSENHVFSDIPTLVDNDGTILEGWYAIIEHLEQSSRSASLLGTTPKNKAEARRIANLFNTMFYADVTRNIVFEKIMKRYIDNSSPDSACIRRGYTAIKQYMEYISWITDRRNWLAGEEFSVADIVAAAHVSCVDYIGSIEWDNYPEAKDWYVRIKSRPSFRDILSDRLVTFSPPQHYSELDF